jgi:hypothetical protein
LRRYEKILTIIVIALFGLQIVPYFTIKQVFYLAIWLLALSYLFAGFWLFNPKENKKYLLPITAGIAFAFSILAIPFLIRVNLEYFYYFFPIPNGLLCIGLTIYLLAIRKKEKITASLKNLSKRAAILLVISCFFTYTPHSFKAFRKVLIVFNNGNDALVNNLLMFDYREESEAALDNGDCERAIEFALKSNNSGKIWLGIKGNEDELINRMIHDTTTKFSPDVENVIKVFINQDDLYPISGTYSNLYKAYRCKANGEYDNNHFNIALLNYITAYKYLITCNHKSNYWDKEKSWALNNIALCYGHLNKNSLADSIYIAAIENYKKVSNTEGNGLAKLYSNLAFSLSKELQFDYSNKLFQGANYILKKDTSNTDNRKDLVINYNGLVENYLKQDSLEEALFFINRAMKFAIKTEPSYCSTKLYWGVCLFKLNEYKKADSVIKNCLLCYEFQPKNNKQNIAECYLILGQVSIALAKYDDARKYLNTGIEITTKNFGSNSSRYAGYLRVLAHLNKIIGDYPASEKQYNRVIEIFTNETGNHNNILPSVLAGLADLEITLSKLNSAKKHSDNSLSIASTYLPLTYPSATDILNEAAYVDYCLGQYKLADTLYRRVIRINNNYKHNSDITIAIALNGLGLIETAKKSFKKANSLFQESLKLHKEILTDNNPLTAIVYLNFGNLCIQEGKLSEAEENINKALTIDKQFFKSDHDIFADIFVALGDLAKKKKQNTVAKDNYKKALDIYKKKFNEEHWKVIETQSKLK